MVSRSGIFLGLQGSPPLSWVLLTSSSGVEVFSGISVELTPLRRSGRLIISLSCLFSECALIFKMAFDGVLLFKQVTRKEDFGRLCFSRVVINEPKVYRRPSTSVLHRCSLYYANIRNSLQQLHWLHAVVVVPVMSASLPQRRTELKMASECPVTKSKDSSCPMSKERKGGGGDGEETNPRNMVSRKNKLQASFSM